MEKPAAITIETTIHAPMEKVWEFWTRPEHIVKWAFASDDWEAPAAENDVRTDGKFKTVMAAKDKSASFDFSGVYTKVKPREIMEYDMDDGRHVEVEFMGMPQGVRITETFELEEMNPVDVQRSGWQAILDNFKKYAEGKKLKNK